MLQMDLTFEIINQKGSKFSKKYFGFNIVSPQGRTADIKHHFTTIAVTLTSTMEQSLL